MQIAVDTEHHLIVHHEVTNVGSDRSQLSSTTTAAKEVLGVDRLEAVADRGYFNGEEIKACGDAGMASEGLLGEPKSFSHGQDPKETLPIRSRCDAAITSMLCVTSDIVAAST